MSQTDVRLVLTYNPGQFTITHTDENASDGQLYALAQAINEFQECDLDKVIRVRTLELN
jgi:hypothetical protein